MWEWEWLDPDMQMWERLDHVISISLPDTLPIRWVWHGQSTGTSLAVTQTSPRVKGWADWKTI